MHHTPALRIFVAAWEDLRLRAYQDDGGVWTIGFGHTRGVKQGDTCTAEQADAWLDLDLADSDEDLNAVLHVPLQQNQYDALVSFTFNLGAHNLSTSTLLRAVNADVHAEAALQLLRWNKVKRRVMRGLLSRRAGEALMYRFADYTGH